MYLIPCLSLRETNHAVSGFALRESQGANALISDYCGRTTVRPSIWTNGLFNEILIVGLMLKTRRLLLRPRHPLLLTSL